MKVKDTGSLLAVTIDGVGSSVAHKGVDCPAKVDGVISPVTVEGLGSPVAMDGVDFHVTVKGNDSLSLECVSSHVM